MHELSIAKSIVDVVKGNLPDDHDVRVLSVSIRVGEYSGVEPSALTEAFPAACFETPLENATLTIELLKATYKCNACGTSFPAAAGLCPRCNSTDYVFESGMELDILSFDIED